MNYILINNLTTHHSKETKLNRVNDPLITETPESSNRPIGGPKSEVV